MIVIISTYPLVSLQILFKLKCVRIQHVNYAKKMCRSHFHQGKVHKPYQTEKKMVDL